MQPMPIARRRVYFYVFVVIFIAVIPVISFYVSGYRLTSDLNIVETGGIYLYSPHTESEMYINGVKAGETSTFSKDLLLQDLKPGTYSILIAKEGFWPWAKEVTVEEKRVAEAIAFLIPKEPAGEIISRMIPDENATTTKPNTKPKENVEYKEALLLFTDAINKKATSTESLVKERPEIMRLSSRGRVGLFLNGNQILAEWLGDLASLPNYFCREKVCLPQVLVFNSLTPIKEYAFYPGREDVILVATRNGIFAIEIDARKSQNFQPIYRGSAPSFVAEGRIIYIKEGSNILKFRL